MGVAACYQSKQSNSQIIYLLYLIVDVDSGRKTGNVTSSNWRFTIGLSVDLLSYCELRLASSAGNLMSPDNDNN